MTNQENKSQAHKSSDFLYLEQLNFNPELRKSFLNFFVTNFRVVLLMIILITIWGVYSFIKLPVESSPEVKIPIAVVITTYPGASPSDIEELVTKKIETGLSGLTNVNKITSNSANSISSITVEFDADADLKDSIRQLRDEVSTVKNDLPADANDPIIKEISLDDTPILSMALAGPYDGFTIRKYAEDIQDELEKISGVREVVVSGGDTAEFEVAYDPAKLIFYNITADQANSAIKGINLAVPAGSFEGSEFVYSVRSDARFFDAEKLSNIPILHTDNGAFVFLKDIASVKEKAIDKTLYSRFSSSGKASENAVTVQIIKKTGGSILDTSDQIKAKIDSMIQSMPKGIHYGTTIDMSDKIREDFNQLVHDFILTIALVFIILLLVIGLKEALVAGLAVPLVFFVTFGVMLMNGISLNFLSMFSLILALGLLVDDAIVVVSATKQYLKTGKFTPEEAVLLVLNDFKVVLTTTTLTTVWAFLPLLLASGIIGQYIRSIPITVSVTLIASLFIALMINHPLAAVLERVRMGKKLFFFLISLILFVGFICVSFIGGIIGIIIFALSLVVAVSMFKWYRRKGKAILKANEILVEQEWRDETLIKKKLKSIGSSEGHEGLLGKLLHGIFHMDGVLPYYENFLKKLLATKKTRIKSLIIVFVLFIAAVMLPATGIVKSEFFPQSDSDTVYVNIEGPSGLKLDETDKIVQKVEEKLLSYKEISDFSTIVGTGAAGGSITGSSGGSPSNSAAITLRLVNKKNRDVTAYQFADNMRKDLEPIKGATITVSSLSGGPPSGSAFEAQIRGDDLQTLDKIANDLKPILASVPGTVNIDISLKASPAEYSFELDPDRLEFYNLNAAYVGSILRMAISGTEVTTVIIDGKETKVIARFDKNKIPDLTAIENLQILNLRKQPVFLKDVAKIDLKPSVEAITRINQKRTVVLSSDVKASARANEVLSAFQGKLAKSYKLPDGYDIVYGGENEQNQESVLSILRAMIIAVALIISTLVIQFNSFKKALIVIVTIPLALIGVFFGMAALRVTLSFPGLIGIVALFGIVVKNAIILVDKINLNIKNNIPFRTSIIDAGKSRLEAIVITSICTIVGILPITLSNETWMSLGSAVIFGLMVSSIFTLFVIPILFMTFIKDGERF
jgi:HAE1 family hydrophobic/amphiphilic exporter-1